MSERKKHLRKGTKKDLHFLKVPKNTVASIIVKWKKFEGTRTLPRAGRLAKLSNLEKGLGQGGDQEPDGHSDRAPEFPEGSHSSVKGTTCRLEFAKRHLKDSQTLRNKIL